MSNQLPSMQATHAVRGEGSNAMLYVIVWQNDQRIGEILMGDPMDYAEFIAREALAHEGLSDYRRMLKMKRIRKAMGYSYP